MTVQPVRAGRKIEPAQEMANHASHRTTKLCDRRSDKITQDAVERIRIE